MADDDRRLLILGENPLEQIWATLGLWESVTVARQSIEDRAARAGVTVDPGLLNAKAVGLTHCLRNAREYIENGADGYTIRAISNYYGCMWFASAILIADYNNNIDLGRLEKFTKFGHGLGNIVDDDSVFPTNEHVFVKQSGFFYHYLANTSLSKASVNAICLPSFRATSYSDVPEAERGMLTNLFELFARIPEIKEGFEYATGTRSPVFKAYHSSRNMSDDSKKMTGRNPFDPTTNPRNERDYTWIGIADGDVPEDHIREFGPKLDELEKYKSIGDEYWHGKLRHPPGEMWYDHIKLYRSAMSQTSWINPLFGVIDEPIALHLMLSYQISIMSRYRPAVWREIVEGKFDLYRTLIALYNQTFPRVVTELVMRNISGRRIQVAMPGAFNAPM